MSPTSSAAPTAEELAVTGEPARKDGAARENLLPSWLMDWLRWFAMGTLVWTVLTLLQVAQQLRWDAVLYHRGITFWPTLIRDIPENCSAALLTPWVVAWTRKLDTRRKSIPILAFGHLVGFALFVYGHAWLEVFVFGARGFSPGAYLPRTFAAAWALFLFYLNNDIYMYFPIVGIAMAATYYQRDRQREIRESQLQTELARAQLLMLKMQLHPHFLFNTLHAISALVSKDPRLAKKMIASLSALLRMAMDSGHQQEIPLKEELDVLGLYLEIEKTRFSDKMSVEMEIASDTLDAMVPSLLLQPLVENAVRHGICSLPADGRILIRATATASVLQLTIADNGPGMTKTWSGNRREGLGLGNTRARLQKLYGKNHRFVLENPASGGLTVLIELPLRRETSTEEIGNPTHHD